MKWNLPSTRMWVIITASALILMGLVWAGFELITYSQWYGNQVRTRLIAQLEQASGGIVSIEKIQIGENRLAFHLYNLEIKSEQAPTMPPIVAIPEAELQFRLLSMLRWRVSLEMLNIHEPHLQVLIGEDGTSNIPVPALSSWVEDGEEFAAEQLLGLEIERLVLTGGKIDWNGQLMNAQFSASELEVKTVFNNDLQEYTLQASLTNPLWEMSGKTGLAEGKVTVEAVLSSSGIDLALAQIEGEGYSIDIEGRLDDLFAPSFSGTYRANAPLALMSYWLRFATGQDEDQEIEGQLALEGNLDWDSPTNQVKYSGSFIAEEVVYTGIKQKLQLEARYSGNREIFEATDISVRTVGVEATGNMSLQLLAGDQQFSGNFDISAMEIEELSVAFGIDKLPWSGHVNASLVVSGSLSEGFVVDTQLKVEPSLRSSLQPVQGKGMIRYTSNISAFTVSSLELSTPAAQVMMDGVVKTSGQTSLGLKVVLESKQALQQIMDLVSPEATLPELTPDGTYTYLGEFYGLSRKPEDPILIGELLLEDFEIAGTHWEELSLQGSLTKSGIEIQNGQLTDGNGLISLHGSLPLQNSEVLNMAITVKSFDAEKLMQTSGLSLPFAGKLTMDLNLFGPMQAYEANGRATIDDFVLWGEEFDSISTDFLYNSSGLELEAFLLVAGDAQLQGKALVAVQDGNATFTLASSHWPLDSLKFVQETVSELEGSLQFKLQGTIQQETGSSQQKLLELDGNWEVSDMHIGEQELDFWKGTLGTNQRQDEIRIDWQAGMLGGMFQGQAVINQQDELLSYSGQLEFNNLPPAQVAELINLPLSGYSGRIDGQAEFSGDLGQPGSLQASGTIDLFEFVIPVSEDEEHLVYSVFPMRWQYANELMRLGSMSLTSNNTDLGISGAVSLAGDTTVDMAIDGQLNMLLLHGLTAGLQPTGTLDVGLRVRGTIEEPRLEGSIQVLDASITSPNNAFRLDEVNGTLAFEDNQINIQKMSASAGEGSVEFSGITTLTEDGLEYRLLAAAKNVRVNYPTNISSVIDGQFTLAGSGARSILNGDMLITRLSTSNTMTFTELFSRLRQPAGFPVANSSLQGMQLNIHISALSNMPIKTPLVRNVEAEFALDLMGTLASPAMLGSIEITQGEVQMLGTRYRINHGNIRFVNPSRTDPVLNIELETRIRDVDLALVLSGPTRDLGLSYRSDPPLPFHDVVNLIAVGREPTADPSIASRQRIEQQSLIQTGADNILSQAIKRPVSQRLQRFFGVSRLKVDPQIGGPEANPSARISTEQQITNTLTLIYSYDLSSSQQQAVRIEWTPDRRWSFIVTRDQNGLVGSDVLYKIRLP